MRPTVVNDETNPFKSLVNRQIYIDAVDSSYDCFTLRGRNPSCDVCSPSATIRSMHDSHDRLTAAMPPAPTKTTIELFDRISVKDYRQLLLQDSSSPHVLLDVRSDTQFQMISITDSQRFPTNNSAVLINIPYSILSDYELIDNPKFNTSGINKAKTRYDEEMRRLSEVQVELLPVFVLCRRGISSLLASEHLVSAFSKMGIKRQVINIDGGLQAWSKDIDVNFPVY